MVIYDYLSKQSVGPVGVVLSFIEDGVTHYGWSLCNHNSGDRFDPVYGIYLATCRALPLTELTKAALLREIPDSVTKRLARLVDATEKLHGLRQQVER